MNLTLLLYIADMADKINDIIPLLLFINILIILGTKVIHFVFTNSTPKYSSDMSKEDSLAIADIAKNTAKFTFIMTILLSILNLLCPTKKTIYYMGLAYVAEKVVTSDKITRLTDNSLNYIELRLKKAIDDLENPTQSKK